MTRKLVSLFAAAAICSATSPAFAGSMVTGLSDSLSATPTHYVGHCPGVITFHATVNVRGRFENGQTVEIGYQFTRSDGGTGQNQFFNVDHAGPHDFTETWTLGGAQVPDFAGWEKFKAWVTDSGQHPPGLGETFSNEAHFTLKCEERR
jgi:hypothetical protein